MYRIRLILPKRYEESYRYADILHDAIVNGWVCSGAKSELVIGMNARIWHFGALGWNRNGTNIVHSLVIGTSDPELTEHLRRFSPSDVRYARAHTAEIVNFSRAEIVPDPDPVLTGQNTLGLLMLSPLAISQREGKNRLWHQNLNDFDLSAAINTRLSRLANRDVRLKVEPDRLYLRCNPKHDTLIPVKESKNGHKGFVIGMRAPLVLQGNEADLRLAWYAGIGEKNRLGFGCIGLAERGIRR